MFLKEAFLSSRFNQPARVSTSDFLRRSPVAGQGAGLPGWQDWFAQYCRLEMRLQDDKTYDVLGFYPLRDLMAHNTVATGLDLKAALGMLRDYQYTRLKTADFDPPGTIDKFGPMEEKSRHTYEETMKRRSRNHIDFVGPRHGLYPRQDIDAARLKKMRVAKHVRTAP